MNAVASDTARAIRKVSASEGPGMRFLSDPHNRAVTRRAYDAMMAERSVGGEAA